MKQIYSLLYNCDPGNSLGGSCGRDLKNVKQLLDSIDGYQHQSYLHSNNQPFKEICRNFISIIPPDSIVIVYLSGHGYQMRDTNGDEKDGYDEYIMTPFGPIIDDEIKSTIIGNLPKGVKFIGVADTCHSGSMFDLTNNICDKYNYLSIGACSDQELENCDIGNEVGFGGALTIQLLESKIGDYCLLEHLIRYFDQPTSVIKVNEVLLDKLKVFGQHPIISCE